MHVHDIAADAALRFGDAVAVEGPDGALSFAELWQRAQGLAAHLAGRGLRPGDRVLEAVPNSCALLVSDIALSLAGLVRVPLNPRLGPREWNAIARDSGARALIGAAVPVAALEGAHDLVVIDPAEAEASAVFTPAPQDLVGLAYSSGTTGLPKGARRTHAMRLASAQAMLDEVIAGTADASAVYLHAGPAIHTSGLFVLPMLRLGVPQLMLDHPRPADIARVVAERSVTHMAVVPTVLAALADLDDAGPAAFGSLRMLGYAGSPMPPARIADAYRRVTPALVQYYGLVEAMPPLAVLDAADHAAGVAGDTALLRSAGRVVPSIRLEVRGGEVVVRGAAVTPGYWNAAERADLGKSVTDGWLATGDVGTLEGGRLWLTDRRSDMVISGGYNIYPGEIEALAAGVPGVRACAAAGVPDPAWGQRLELAYTGEAEPDAVAAACEPLPRFKRPKRIVRLEELPLGATGKVDRRALAAQLADADAEALRP